VGLAQEINNGLSNSLMKIPKWAEFEEQTNAMKSKLVADGPEACLKSPLGRWILQAWARKLNVSLSDGRRASSAGAYDEKKPPTDAGVKANWDKFIESSAMDILARYTAYGETTLKNKKIGPKEFEEMRPLGKGAFGAVFLVFKKDTGYALAVKKANKKIIKQNKMVKDVKIERKVLGEIKSRFCVGLHYAYQTEKEIMLMITLMPGGDLSFLLKSRQDEKTKELTKLPESVIKYYAAGMACGLDAVHKAGYVYRDLKPLNVLLDAEGKLRISDMGLTADISKGPIKQKSGTRGFWSPETINKGEYTTEPDWWSLGVTIYILYSDKKPFHGKTDDEEDASTVAGVLDFKHGEPEPMQKIIQKLCTIDQKARLQGLDNLKKDPYFEGFDWNSFEAGEMEAEIKPNPNDINAPSKSEISAFKDPKDVDWTDDDQAAFNDWDYYGPNMFLSEEAVFAIDKKDKASKAALGTSGGGGGCCVIA